MIKYNGQQNFNPQLTISHPNDESRCRLGNASDLLEIKDIGGERGVFYVMDNF